ncbi:response regulator [Streptacidiphilus sp. PAMC 29251]
MTIRVLLADDQPLLRLAFSLLIDSQPDLSVCGEAANGTEAIEMAVTRKPDLVLMDVRMPGVDGIEATREIVARCPDTRVLILTTFDLDEYAFTGLTAGASGFLLKNARPDELLGAIRVIAAGEAVIAPRVTRRLLETFAHRFPTVREPTDTALASLTARERGVLTYVAQGLSNAEIATELGVAENTVKTHVSRMLIKLGLRDRVQAVVFAYDHRLVLPS